MIRHRARCGILEENLEAELNFTWRSERVDAGTHADAIGVVRRGIGAVDRSRRARKQAGHWVRWEIEIGKIENVVEAHRWLHSDPFCEGMGPRHCQIKNVQPTQIHLV